MDQRQRRRTCTRHVVRRLQPHWRQGVEQRHTVREIWHLPQLLRNMADYLEQDNYPWIHPSEKPCHPKIYKRKYNELKKIMLEKEQIEPPPMPKKKRKVSVRLLSYFKKYNIDPNTNSSSSSKEKKSSHTNLCGNNAPNDLSSLSTQSCTGVKTSAESRQLIAWWSTT